MMDLELSEQQQELYDLLAGGAEVSIDDIQNVMVGVSRHTIIGRLKYLAMKLAPTGLIISRVSGIGRGCKGVYTMERKFG